MHFFVRGEYAGQGAGLAIAIEFHIRIWSIIQKCPENESQRASKAFHNECMCIQYMSHTVRGLQS